MCQFVACPQLLLPVSRPGIGVEISEAILQQVRQMSKSFCVLGCSHLCRDHGGFQPGHVIQLPEVLRIADCIRTLLGLLHQAACANLYQCRVTTFHTPDIQYDVEHSHSAQHLHALQTDADVCNFSLNPDQCTDDHL